MNEEIKTEQKESIKLCKMSKGYNWEIKVHMDKEMKDEDDHAIFRIERIDAALREKFLKGGAEDD